MVGGIIFAIFVPLKDNLSWIDFLFYAIIGFLIILYQSLSFIYKRKRIKEMMDALSPQYKDSSIIPVDSTPNTLTTRNSTAGQKEALKIDEYAVAYCPTCGQSFTKKYKFCPKCGSCKIKGML